MHSYYFTTLLLQNLFSKLDALIEGDKSHGYKTPQLLSFGKKTFDPLIFSDLDGMSFKCTCMVYLDLCSVTPSTLVL